MYVVYEMQILKYIMQSLKYIKYKMRALIELSSISMYCKIETKKYTIK